VILSLASPAFSQTWLKVAGSEQQALTLSVSLPAGTTYRIGDTANNKWCVATATAAVTLVDYADGLNGRLADCDSGTPKEFDVLETVSTQTVTLTDASVTPAKVTTVPVPALPPPASYPPVIVTPGNVVAMVYGSVTIIPGSPLSQIIPLVNLPPFELMATVLQNLNFKLTFEGIVYDCTFAGTQTASVSQNCIAEPVPTK
jgi:hypothetical protein